MDKKRGVLVYESSLETGAIAPRILEWGKMSTCFLKDRVGEFTCNCGLHYVKAHVEEEPLSQERIVLHVVRRVFS